ncbi:MAG: guanylate kinase [Anaerolineae bacterium]|nr:guanylate kinase [Anaerolineae bacterium]
MQNSSTAADPFDREHPPLLIVISGPSGAGKDSVVQRMKERGFPFHFVVTATDRAPRPNEVHGQDYYFYTTAEFERMIDEDELLEHAWVYGQHKGIPKAHVREALASGQDVVMRVDVQGAETVKGILPAAITIFLVCESEEELVARLRARRTESEEALQKRLHTAHKEMACIPDFDYVVVNRHGTLDDAVDDVVAIMRAEHCRSVPRRIQL